MASPRRRLRRVTDWLQGGSPCIRIFIVKLWPGKIPKAKPDPVRADLVSEVVMSTLNYGEEDPYRGDGDWVDSKDWRNRLHA